MSEVQAKTVPPVLTTSSTQLLHSIKDQVSSEDSGSDTSAKMSGSTATTPVTTGASTIRTRASTGSISGLPFGKTEIKSERCSSPSSDTCSSRSGTPQSFKRTRHKIDDLYIVQVPPKKQKIGRNDGTGLNNKNDYFCWLCHRDGEVVCCELCPRVYHIKCLGLDEPFPEVWVCPECEKIMRAECINTRSKAMSMISHEQFCVLLKYALNRMKHQSSSPFRQPVDLCAVPNYHDFIYHPMDLNTVEKNIKNNKYGSTEAFLADVKWILHNCIIFNGTHHKLTASAKMIIKICKHEVAEIEICPDCYARSCEQSNDEWFCEPCSHPHQIVWAKLKGYPFWPAKALREKNGMVDVRFFGAHDRSWVPVSQVYLYSKECPTVMKSKRSGFDHSMTELKTYIEKYRQKFGTFEFYPFRSLYDSNSPYIKNGKSSKLKSLKLHPSPKRTKSPESSEANSKKNNSSLSSSKSSSSSSSSKSTSSDSKMSEKVSVITKTASAVKNKYSSIITTRRGAMMKMLQLTSTAASTQPTQTLQSTTVSSSLSSSMPSSSSSSSSSSAFSTSQSFTSISSHPSSTTAAISAAVGTTTTITTSCPFNATPTASITTTKTTTALTTKPIPNKAPTKPFKRSYSSSILPKKRACPGVFFPSSDSDLSSDKSPVKVCMESVGEIEDKVFANGIDNRLKNIKTEPGLELESSESRAPSHMPLMPKRKMVQLHQIKQEVESPIDKNLISHMKSYVNLAPKPIQDTTNVNHGYLKAGRILKPNAGFDSILMKNNENSSNQRKDKPGSTPNNTLSVTGNNQLSLILSSPPKKNTSLRNLSDSQMSAFRPLAKMQKQVSVPTMNQQTTDKGSVDLQVSDPGLNSNAGSSVRNTGRKTAAKTNTSTSAGNKNGDSKSTTDESSNLALPSIVTDATLLLGLLKNKPGENSAAMRSDASRPIEINQMVEKYTKQLSKSIRESFEEMYADMLTKHSHQIIMKHYHQELEKLRWIHEQEIAEIKHNLNLTVAEIRASWENEKERFASSIREQCDIEKMKSIEETKKKQWCANCSKEALLYCCWNTSYCDYQCQANHWPQHMNSCTQQLSQTTSSTVQPTATHTLPSTPSASATTATVSAAAAALSTTTTPTTTLSGTLMTGNPQNMIVLNDALPNTTSTTAPIVISTMRQQPVTAAAQQLPEIRSVETLNTTVSGKPTGRVSGMLQQIIKKEDNRSKMINLQPASNPVPGTTQIQFLPTSLPQPVTGSIQVLPAPSTQLLTRNPILSPSHQLQLQYMQSPQQIQTYAATSGQAPVRMQAVQLQSTAIPSTLQSQTFPSIMATSQSVSSPTTKINTISAPTVAPSGTKNLKVNTSNNIIIPSGPFILTKASQGHLQLNATKQISKKTENSEQTKQSKRKTQPPQKL
ncbi:kinase C-binding 1-like isoform X1 [Octopus vulgaris]|uniref:Kinase C-binding 1-like isoform X1 n=2 Tax=Octopus TaxID=6643 RepID=A0AA36F1H3_OCTVU|nr:protein kinase C-binding protein 1 isoform X2 [Octopus sinensis]CAI9721069.1 kinase C-binding 1-like isoform X1 [Octopus vulgaris]